MPPEGYAPIYHEVIHRHVKGRKELRALFVEYDVPIDTVDMMVETASVALRDYKTPLMHLSASSTLVIHRKWVPSQR